MFERVKFAAGLTIIFLVIGLRAAHLLEWTDAQFLFGIAACLLGVWGLLKGGGK